MGQIIFILWFIWWSLWYGHLCHSRFLGCALSPSLYSYLPRMGTSFSFSPHHLTVRVFTSSFFFLIIRPLLLYILISMCLGGALSSFSSCLYALFFIYIFLFFTFFLLFLSFFFLVISCSHSFSFASFYIFFLLLYISLPDVLFLFFFGLYLSRRDISFLYMPALKLQGPSLGAANRLDSFCVFTFFISLSPFFCP